MARSPELGQSCPVKAVKKGRIKIVCVPWGSLNMAVCFVWQAIRRGGVLESLVNYCTVSARKNVGAVRVTKSLDFGMVGLDVVRYAAVNTQREPRAGVCIGV